MTTAAHRPSPSRSIARGIAVVLLAGWVLGTSWANLAFLWEPPGTFGMLVDYDGVVKGVEAGSPAALASIHPADRIDLALTDREARNLVVPAKANAAVGTTIELWLDRPSGPTPVTITAAPLSSPRAFQFALVMRRLAALVFLAVGSALVLLRPSPTTWGFFLFCVGLNPQTFYVTFARYPSALSNIIVTVLDDVFISAGVIGLLVFCLHFGRDSVAGWRRAVERSTPFLFLLCVVLTAYPDYANLALGLSAGRIQTLSLVLRGAILALAVYALLDTYMRGPVEARQRIRWVAIGLVLGVAGTYTADILVFSNAPFALPDYAESALLLLSAMLPLAVAYAVVRHRVIDVSFVISRALTYGALTAVIILCFSILHWLLGEVLQASRLTNAAEIALVIALSYSLAVLHRRIETFTERVFFRRRHEAEARLDSVALALPRASSLQAVDELTQSEASSALALASAAVFRREDGGTRYVRTASSGWSPNTAETLDPDDKLVLLISSKRVSLRVRDVDWERPDLPAGTARPVLAVPFVIRDDVPALALFGAHLSGEDLDPDEVRTIAGLVRGACTGYEHVTAELLRKENERLTQEVAALRMQLGTSKGSA
jgi:hypothetical protein